MCSDHMLLFNYFPYRTLLRILRDKPEQKEFCNIHGMNAMWEALKTEENWSTSALRPFLISCHNAVEWLNDKDLTEDLLLLKRQMVASVLVSVTLKVVEFLLIFTEKYWS